MYIKSWCYKYKLGKTTKGLGDCEKLEREIKGVLKIRRKRPGSNKNSTKRSKQLYKNKMKIEDK